MNGVSRSSMIILALLAMAYFLPHGFWKLFGAEQGHTLLLYSPLQERFLFRQTLGGHSFRYLDENGQTYERPQFEEQLPFLYYRDLDKKGKLPITVGGRAWDKKTIKANKQGLEIKARHIKGHQPQIALYPLFNNDPAKAMLPFPDDAFRITGERMEFVNADFNRTDEELTERFTSALKNAGFVYPATVIGGKATNLKPFDEGYLIRDAQGAVFHVKRELDQPIVVKTPIPSDLDIQDIIVAENRRREFYGVAVTRDSRLFLITYNNYRLVQLTAPEYDWQRMNMKLLVTPLHRTVVVSDDQEVYGTVMDSSYTPVHSFTPPPTPERSPLAARARDILFPFRLEVEDDSRGRIMPRLVFGSWLSFVGLLLFTAVGFILVRGKRRLTARNCLRDLLIILFTGLYGLLILLIMPAGE